MQEISISIFSCLPNKVAFTNKISSQEVHVWLVNLNQFLEQTKQNPEYKFEISNTLSEDEVARSKKFYQQKHQDNFTIARGLLRILLGSYLNTKPSQIQFLYSDRGKPYINSPLNLRFNLSHSGDYALYAVSCDREIGIDLEYIDRNTSIEQLTRRFFLPSEQKQILACQGDSQIHAFFTCWTLKEAYAKATGAGIAHSLEGIDTTAILENPSMDLVLEPWLLRKLNINSTYAAAIAVEGKNWQLQMRSLSP